MTESPTDPGAPLGSALDVAPELERFFRRRGHGNDSADLVQDLFVVLLTRDGLLARIGPASLRSFLFAVAYRIGANAARRRRLRSHATLEETAEPAAGTGDPEGVALSGERARRVAAALHALPDDTRSLLLLAGDEGLTPRQIAARLGLGEVVVRARLCRGRRRLAAILKETS